MGFVKNSDLADFFHQLFMVTLGLKHFSGDSLIYKLNKAVTLKGL